MIIQACIGDDEVDFILEPKEIIEDGEKVIKWEGSVENAFIKFTDKSNQIENLNTSPDITTNIEIIQERIMDGLSKHYEAIRTGVEETDSVQKEIPPYDPEKIKVRPLTLSAFEVMRYIKKNAIKLEPDFQRNFVWDNTRKSRLIESMLLKIPLPAFYFWEDSKGNFEVIDGLQRLTVINEFLNNQFKLRNLQYLDNECGGCYYDDPDKKKILPSELAGRVERTQLNINVIESGSPENVKYEIFSRINTLGRPLNKQEIRHCFASIDLRKFLKQIVKDPIFIEATVSSVSDIRMDAQELVLRFLAFFLYRKDYKGDMEPFLNETQGKLNNLKESEFNPLRESFLKGLKNSYQLFGQYAFRKCLPDHLEPKAKKQLINKSLFLTWTVILSKVDPNSLKNNLVGKFAEPLAHVFEESSKRSGDYPEYYRVVTTGTGDKSNLELAFEYAEKFTKEVVGVAI